MPIPNETSVTHMVNPDDLRSVQLDLSTNTIDQKFPGIPIAVAYVTANLTTHLLWKRAIQRLEGDIVEVPFPSLVHARDTKLYREFILTYASLASAIVLNHPELHASQIAANISPVPIIHANLPLEAADYFGVNAQHKVLTCMAILDYVLRANK